jgi:hypothetical protein
MSQNQGNNLMSGNLIIIDNETNTNFINCPNCNDLIIIKKVNCGIFRHGVLKKNNKQIPPHAKKDFCDKLVKDDLIYGCGQPFQIIKDKTDPKNIQKMKVVICDYI